MPLSPLQLTLPGMDDEDDIMRAMGFPVQFAGRSHAGMHRSKRPKGIIDNVLKFHAYAVRGKHPLICIMPFGAVAEGNVSQAFVSPWFVCDSKRVHWLEECFASKDGPRSEEGHSREEESV